MTIAYFRKPGTALAVALVLGSFVLSAYGGQGRIAKRRLLYMTGCV